MEKEKGSPCNFSMESNESNIIKQKLHNHKSFIEKPREKIRVDNKQLKKNCQKIDFFIIFFQ